MRFIVSALIFFIPAMICAAGNHLIDTASVYMERGEYYNAITETMRYRYLYPSGEQYGESLIISGKAYYKGGAPGEAVNMFQESFRYSPDSYHGQQGLYYLGMVRLVSGSTSFALNNFQEYNYIYRNGYFYEDSLFYLCVVRALSEDYIGAESSIENYIRIFPEGNYREKAENLSLKIKNEREKPWKSPLKAAAASALIPGLGYIYTDNYTLGFISFATNGLFLYLIYDGYKKQNDLQMIFFSLVELSFYNYSIIGSIKSAHDYNSSDSFKKELIMGVKKEF
jgi:tetratricopeptide (TPR) repeat protein